MLDFLFPLTDKKIFGKLGKKLFIRNGVGYNFISEEYLYDNCFLELGFGRTRSGRGDWGGGADYATTCPLKIIIDKNFIIQKIETDSFYNSDASQEVEKIAKKLVKKLKIGSKLILKDSDVINHVSKILEYLPCKNHIGHDVGESPHMLEYFTDPKEKDHYRLRDSKWEQNKK